MSKLFSNICLCDRRFSRFAILVGILVALSTAAEGNVADAGVSNELQPFSVHIVPAVATDGVPTKGHVLLIPGLGSPGSVWDQTVDVLAADGYTLHVFHLAGFAGLPSQEGLLLPRVHRALIDYVRGLNAKPAVIGHSLGGTLALWLAASEVELFGPIVAVDGVAFLPALRDPSATEETARPQAEQLRGFLAAMTTDAYDVQTAMTLSTMITDPDTARRVAEASRGSDPRVIGDAVFDLMTRDLRADLAAIQAPVLLLAAGAPATSEAAAEQLLAAYEAQVAAVPDHRVELVAGARHFVMLDATDRFLKLVRAHLNHHGS